MNLFKKYSIFLLAAIFTFSLFYSGCAQISQPKGRDLLCDFEKVKPWDTSPEKGFSLRVSKKYTTQGKHSLEVIYPAGGLPSINIKKLPGAWGDYDYFSFDVFNPHKETLPFNIRLDDTKRKRFNLSYPLKSGWNNVRVARSRIASKIDAANIRFVVLFLSKPKQRFTLYFDNMRLERSGDRDVKASAIRKQEPRAEPLPTRKAADLPKFRVVTRGEIKVPVTRIKKSDTRVLVSTGIPFAPGQLASGTDVAFFNEQGREIPIAVKVLARWPQDNSIRSLLVQFKFEIKHLYEYVVMKWGYLRSAADIGLTEPDWDYPEGLVIMPKEWLCASQVIGEQAPMGQQEFPKYDENIEKRFPKIRDAKLTGNLAADGYYSTPHVFYQFYVRSGELEYFLAARKELLHYRDNEIIHQGAERGRSKFSNKARYVYVEALADDYLLTGDSNSLRVAGYMAEYLKNKFNPKDAFFAKNATRFWTEREQAFLLLGMTAYYELTLDPEYLKAAGEYMSNLYKTQLEWPSRGGFIHNLYSHDPEEGARRDEYGGSPFMAGLLLEAVIKYHRLTGSDIAADSIFRALDWLINEGLVASGDSFRYTTADVNRDSDGTPDLNLLVVHAFGYGYRLSGYQRKDYLEIGKRVFERGIKQAYLSRRKHFNQNYRNSGPFLAYIKNYCFPVIYHCRHQAGEIISEEQAALDSVSAVGQTSAVAGETGAAALQYEPSERRGKAIYAKDKNFLFFEGFESSAGRFKSFSKDALLRVDTNSIYSDGSSLNIKSKFSGSNLSAGIELANWDIRNYPYVSFSYLIPPNTPVGMRVKTEYGDFICIGGADSYQCQGASSPKAARLIDDGEWQDITIDIKDILGAIVSGVVRLGQFEFHTGANAESGDEFWIGEFGVRE